MSGPKTSQYRITAALLRRAEKELRRQEQQRRHELEALRQQEKAERQRLELQRRIDLQSSIDRAEERLAGIAEAAQLAQRQFPGEHLSLPEAAMKTPKGANLSTLASHLNAMESLAQAQEMALAAEMARLHANASMRQTLAGLLRYAKGDKASSAPHKPIKTLSRDVAENDRWLRRLDLFPGEEPPAAILEIIADLRTAAPARRAPLETELSWRIQSFNAHRKAEREFSLEAATLYEALPLSETKSQQEMLDQLTQAALGKLPLNEDLLARAKAWRDQAQAQAVSRQAAQVLRESLQELGYEVEEGFSTLFVSGGMLHFTRPEWQGYYARLRVRPGESHLNFNLVRADVGPPTLEQQRRDQEAETRWCAEYRRLIDRLAQGGLDTQSLRELPPGAVPIQGVPAEQLPERATATGKRRQPIIARRRSTPDS